MAIDRYQLKIRQAYPLDMKIRLTQERIKQWVDYWGVDGVYVAFSGGKDSTVLLHLVRQLYPNVPAVFVDTGLEYPEIKRFVNTVDNVTILRPELRFDKVIEEYGYPIISKSVAKVIEICRNCEKRGKKDTSYQKRLSGEYVVNGKKSLFNCEKWKFLLNAPFKISHKCCDIMKKKPIKKYRKDTGRKGILGIMACESVLRTAKYLENGCNAFNAKEPNSQPMAFWLEQDVLKYLYDNKIPYASIYGQIVPHNGIYITTGEKRTGCMFCAFGCHLEKSPNRFERMKETHPAQYDYCINKMGFNKVLDYIGVKY